MASENAGIMDAECPDGTCPLKRPSSGGHRISTGGECRVCGGGRKRKLAPGASIPMQGRASPRAPRGDVKSGPIKLGQPTIVPTTVTVVPSQTPGAPPSVVVTPEHVAPPQGTVYPPNQTGMVPVKSPPRLATVLGALGGGTINRGMMRRPGAGSDTAQGGPIKLPPMNVESPAKPASIVRAPSTLSVNLPPMTPIGQPSKTAMPITPKQAPAPSPGIVITPQQAPGEKAPLVLQPFVPLQPPPPDYCSDPRFAGTELCQRRGDGTFPALSSTCATTLLALGSLDALRQHELCGPEVAALLAAPAATASSVSKSADSAKTADAKGMPIDVPGAVKIVAPGGAPVAVDGDRCLSAFLRLNPVVQQRIVGLFAQYPQARVVHGELARGVMDAPPTFVNWFRSAFRTDSPEASAFCAAVLSAMQGVIPAGAPKGGYGGKGLGNQSTGYYAPPSVVVTPTLVEDRGATITGPGSIVGYAQADIDACLARMREARPDALADAIRRTPPFSEQSPGYVSRRGSGPAESAALMGGQNVWGIRRNAEIILTPDAGNINVNGASLSSDSPWFKPALAEAIIGTLRTLLRDPAQQNQIAEAIMSICRGWTPTVVGSDAPKGGSDGFYLGLPDLPSARGMAPGKAATHPFQSGTADFKASGAPKGASHAIGLTKTTDAPIVSVLGDANDKSSVESCLVYLEPLPDSVVLPALRSIGGTPSWIGQTFGHLNGARDLVASVRAGAQKMSTYDQNRWQALVGFLRSLCEAARVQQRPMRNSSDTAPIRVHVLGSDDTSAAPWDRSGYRGSAPSKAALAPFQSGTAPFKAGGYPLNIAIPSRTDVKLATQPAGDVPGAVAPGWEGVQSFTGSFGGNQGGAFGTAPQGGLGQAILPPTQTQDGLSTQQILGGIGQVGQAGLGFLNQFLDRESRDHLAELQANASSANAQIAANAQIEIARIQAQAQENIARLGPTATTQQVSNALNSSIPSGGTSSGSSEGMSTGAKVGIAAAVGAVVVGGVYVATRKRR